MDIINLSLGIYLSGFIAVFIGLSLNLITSIQQNCQVQEESLDKKNVVALKMLLIGGTAFMVIGIGIKVVFT